MQALRFETFEQSALASLLLQLSIDNCRFAFEFYWFVNRFHFIDTTIELLCCFRQLQQRIDHSSNVPYASRCILLQRELMHVRDEQFRREVECQHRLLANLDSYAADLKASTDVTRLVCSFNLITTLI